MALQSENDRSVRTKYPRFEYRPLLAPRGIERATNLRVGIDIELGKMRERLGHKGMGLELDTVAKDFLIDKGYNPDFGARPLRRAISQFIEDPLAESLLSGEFKSGHKIMVTRKDEAENLFFESVEMPKEEADGEKSEGDEAEKAATA